MLDILGALLVAFIVWKIVKWGLKAAVILGIAFFLLAWFI